MISIHRIQKEFKFTSPEDLLSWGQESPENYTWMPRRTISPGERRRFDLMVQMYKLLHQKYNLSFQELREELMESPAGGVSPAWRPWLIYWKQGIRKISLMALLTCLERLKEIILSSETFPAKEAIYHKRHIAVDIPSVYGRYQERKFDSLRPHLPHGKIWPISFWRSCRVTVNLSFITQGHLFFALSPA